MEQWLVIGISGVTCSGKTTLAQQLHKYLKEKSGHELKAGIELNRVELLNQDVYFRSVDDPKHQKIEKLNHLNWEIIESINMDKMIADIMEVLGKKFYLYRTRSSALMTCAHQENLFNLHYVVNQAFTRTSSRGTDGTMFFNDDHCNFKKIVKHNNLLNILILEGFLIFNHAVTFDLCNIKYHLHVPYEVCYSRRKKRCYDPPDVPCKNLINFWRSDY
jgi:nicotinamide/nicotinate riboside kinase